MSKYRERVESVVSRQQNAAGLPPYVQVKTDGKWYVRLHFPTSQKSKNGHRKYIEVARQCVPQTWERAAELVAFIEKERSETIAGVGDPKTVAQYVGDYLGFRRKAVAQRTSEMDGDLYRRFVVKKSFGDKILADVRPIDVQQFYSDLEADGHSPDAIRRVHALLSKAFRQAIIWEVLAKNPARGAILPKVVKEESAVMGLDEARALISACREYRNFVIFEFALETGMRPQEYLGLRWSDIDLEKNTARVVQVLARGLKGGGFQIKEPKTPGSKRTIHFTPSLAERLRAHKAAQDDYLHDLRAELKKPLVLKHMQRKGVNYERRRLRHRMVREYLKNFEEFALVFPSESGTPDSGININRRLFKDALRAAGIDEGYTLYSLRHTCATLSLAAGANLKAVAEKLGHSDYSVLLKIYAHVSPEMRSNTAEQLAKALY